MQTRRHGDATVKSMTGFGRGRSSSDSFEIVTEIKGVNHRYLEISIRSPRFYSMFDPEIRKILSSAVSRGKYEVNINRIGEKSGFMEVAFDEVLARKYHGMLLRMKQDLGLEGPITVGDMLSLESIIQPVEKEEAIADEWPILQASVAEAMENLDKMRTTEGAALWADVEARTVEIRKMTETITPLVGEISASAHERIQRRVQELSGGLDLDKDRLLQEVALVAERADVTEELTRIDSHLKQFSRFGQMGSPLGRKLDFLLQELNREINTLGSKAGSSSISPSVVAMKSELEKIREQIQNIE